MNDLAHFHLAAATDGLLVGALLGDHVKGILRDGEWPESWLAGIRLHRRIDAVADHHPALEPCRASLPPTLRRYAGIILDVSLDHWLAIHWPSVSAQPLPEFEQRVYRVLADALPRLPESARQHAEMLIQHQPLQSYRDWEMVPTMLGHISKRLAHNNPLGKMAHSLRPLWPHWQQPFANFYADLPRALQDIRPAR